MHGTEHVLLCSSGTYAVEAALRGLGIGAGDAVLVAGYDFPGNFRAIEAVGARPVLVDIEPDTWSLDVDALEASHATALEAAAGAKIRGVIASHLHGGMVPMQRLMALAKERGWQVVEDACQSPGAKIDGRLAGTWGDVGVLSFGGSKLLTAGRGGAIVTPRADVLQRAKIYGHRGNDAFPLSELQAAALVPQLELLEERNQRRRAAVTQLLTATRDIEVLRPLGTADEAAEPSYYKLAWRLEAEENVVSRAAVIVAIQAEGIAIDAGFRGFVDRGERRCSKVGELVHSRAAVTRTLLLHHPVLLEDDAVLNQVAQGLKKISRAEALANLDAATGEVA